MYFNPYNNNFPYPSNTPTPIGIPHVNGTNGAQAYQMPSNSSVLLLDETSPIVYLVKTDSACYKTITPYAISEVKPEQSVDVRSLLDRVSAIERRLDESNIATNEPSSNNTTNRSSKTANGYSSMLRQSDSSYGDNAGKQSSL